MKDKDKKIEEIIIKSNYNLSGLKEISINEIGTKFEDMSKAQLLIIGNKYYEF